MVLHIPSYLMKWLALDINGKHRGNLSSNTYWALLVMHWHHLALLISQHMDFSHVVT